MHLRIRNMFCRYCGELVASVPARYYCDERCARAGGIEAAQQGYGSTVYQRAMKHYRDARATQNKPEEILNPAELSQS
jgi:phage FluMu protein Com